MQQETDKTAGMQYERLIPEIRAVYPQLDAALAAEHIHRLEPRYFSGFSTGDIADHILLFTKLTAREPAAVLVKKHNSEQVECVVLSCDYPYAFSIISGVLASLGFNIESGDIFTYAHNGRYPGKEKTGKRKIIDRFTGRIRKTFLFKEWEEELRKRLLKIFRILAQETGAGLDKARREVNGLVADRIRELKGAALPVLYPMHITMDNAQVPYTRMRILSQDTPCFLYALSNALSMQGICIEQMQIRTEGSRIEDLFCITDGAGNQITDVNVQNNIKLSVLLTKQFTYFLGHAPDSFAALTRFEALLKDILRLPGRGEWVELLANPGLMEQLSRVLGASDFIWEDFIRLQYETLLPMLAGSGEGRGFSRPLESAGRRLADILKQAHTPEEQKLLLNQFKDREIYLIDLEYIIGGGTDFKNLSTQLTLLAEEVVKAAADIAYAELEQRFGIPCTVAGLPARLGIFGLGKLGGAALGYASDIELLFVYSDHGTTGDAAGGSAAGKAQIANSDFYSRLVQRVIQLITAKREGIFHLDLRLRPYGKDGPLAVSLESFCKYYGSGGHAHSLERLALVRLRSIGGDPGFCSLVENIRDQMLYSSPGLINLAELRQARAKQFQALNAGNAYNAYNAKFSPGALADLEYDVQLLQIMHGEKVQELKTPRLSLALEALAAAGVLESAEKNYLGKAYSFFRQLINALRMLRGSARDLFLPAAEAEEYRHLARRMGYKGTGDLSPAAELHVDFEANTAIVRAFAEKYFGRDALPGPVIPNIADLILSQAPSAELKEQILGSMGFKNCNLAYKNFMLLAGKGEQQENFIHLVILAANVLAVKPDADLALNNWERFARVLPDISGHYQTLLRQPRQLDLLLDIFSHSQFLSNTLIRFPGFLDQVLIPEELRVQRTRQEWDKQLANIARHFQFYPDWLEQIRVFKKREMLRIGIRDICLHVALNTVMEEISALAEALLAASLAAAWEQIKPQAAGKISTLEFPLAILAFGKLGGCELNYSSDIDLLIAYDEEQAEVFIKKGLQPLETLFCKVIEQLTSALSHHTNAGYVYRVDHRLRPFGKAGRLVGSITDIAAYYREQAASWEIQALLKLRPVAGNIDVGRKLVDILKPLFSRKRPAREIIYSIEHLRKKKLDINAGRMFYGIDLKDGKGGIRDIEFLVQGLQLIYIPMLPGLLIGNTLEAIAALQKLQILPGEAADKLVANYILFRRIEHFLQIFEDQQTHELPADPAHLESLARKTLGISSTAGKFSAFITQRMEDVHSLYRQFLTRSLYWGGRGYKH